MTTFAGLTMPRTEALTMRHPLRKRLADFKADGKRLHAHTGPYIYQCSAANGQFSFYLESDFAPGLRWRFADHVNEARIRHSGWFCDDDCSQTIRGIVLALPHGRGFLAGWSMGEGMATSVDKRIYSDEVSAAYAADSWAERVAEDERDARAELDHEDDTEH